MDGNAIYVLFIVEMLFFLFFVRNSGYIEKRVHRMYMCAIACNIVTLVSYIGRFTAEEYHILPLAYVANTLIYLAGPSIAFFMVLCVCKKGEILYIVSISVEVIHAVFSLTSCFTGFYFSITEDAVYIRNSSANITFGFAGAFGLIWLVRMIINYRTVDRKDKLYTILLGVLEFFAIVLQAVDGRFKIEYFGAAFLLMIYYVFMIETDGKYDKMSGLYSRRYYFNVVSRTIDRNDEYTVMFFDANGLKTVNDNFGHDSGDVLIKTIADTIRAVTKGVAKVFRIGGDEFIAIVYTTDEDELNDISVRINDELKEKSRDSQFEISVAVGYAIHDRNELHEDTEKRADAEMYRNKEDYYSRTRKHRRQT